jgi:hypothetical protein
MRQYGIVPPGMKTGCLPRRTKPGQTCPLFSSRIKPISRGEWEERSNKITLRPFVRKVYNQGDVGSCASESKDQAVAICLAGKFGGSDGASLVPLFNPYGTYHFVNGGSDQGSTLDDNLNFGREYGCFPESVWPRSKGWQTRPDDAAMAEAAKCKIIEYYDILSVEEFVTALLYGIPVTYGANGHAVTAVAHLHRQNAPQIVNSWSESWEDGGFGIWVPYSGLGDMLRYGAYAVRTATMNASMFQEPV